MSRNQVIILEGPDGGGKTTLAKWLEKHCGFQVWHEGPPPEGRDQLQHYGSTLLRALQQKKPVVFDRLHLGELIYGPIVRNIDTLGYFGARLINRICHAHNVPIVICLPPLDTVVENWREKMKQGDDYVRNEKKIHDVYYRYKALSVYHETYDYTHPDANQFVVDLLGKSVRRDPDFPLYSLGWPTAKFLIVGESPGGELDCAFFSDKNCSGFLNKAIWDAGYREREIFLVNAYNQKGEMNDLFLVGSHLPNLRAIIALGKKAAERSLFWRLTDRSDEKLPIYELPHPQYWKRFKNGQREEYVEQLAKIRGKYV